MKKMLLLFTAFCFTLSACALNTSQPQATSPAPISEADIQATVAVQVEQTIESLPTTTLAPSNTPLVIIATSAPTQTQTLAPPTPTSTGTANPTILTLTATLGTGTPTVTVVKTPTLPFTATAKLNPAFSVTPTEISQYQYYGTMPPNLAYGNITLSNMSKLDAYISLQCTTPDGYTTIIEYPLGGSRVEASAPAGQYVYVTWVGGKKFTGSFKLSKSQDLTIRIYKDRIELRK